MISKLPTDKLVVSHRQTMGFLPTNYWFPGGELPVMYHMSTIHVPHEHHSCAT